MNIRKVSLFVVALFFVLFVNFNAQNFNDVLRLSTINFSPSASSLGMGDATISLGGDWNASFTNPAGLALMKHTEISGGIYYSNYDNNVSFFGSRTDFNQSSTKLNQFGFAYVFPTYRGSFVIGMGFNQQKDFNAVTKFSGFNSANNSMIQDLVALNDDMIYNLGLSYPTYDAKGNYEKDATKINGRLNQSGKLTDEGSNDTWSFAGGIEIAKNVFFGIALNLFDGEYNSSRDYYEDDTKDIYTANILLDDSDSRTADFERFYLNDVLDWKISGWNLHFGMLYKADFFNIGMGIKFPSLFTIKERYSVYGESYFGTGNTFRTDPDVSEIEYDLSTPFEFSAGASFQLALLTFSGDVRFVDFTQMKFTDGLSDNEMSANNSEIKELFRTTLNYSLGAEVFVPGVEVKLRAGYVLRPSPFKDDPQDFDKKFYTFGAGFSPVENIDVDFAYVTGKWKDYTDNYGNGESRVFEDIKYSKAVLTIRYRY